MKSPCVRYTPFCDSCPDLPPGQALDYSINAPIGTHDTISQPLCKYTTPYAKPAVHWTAGQPVTVEFHPHAAVHGGGHCQFSLSYDGGKTFVVIHDELRYCFTGGPTSSNTATTLTYTFNLPASLPSSDKAVFSWSFFNAIGNREFYQNCADVSISGSSPSSSYTGMQMLVANYGPGSPYIPEFNGNYETGIDLLNARPMITVTGSSSYANASVPAAPYGGAAPAPTPTSYHEAVSSSAPVFSSVPVPAGGYMPSAAPVPHYVSAGPVRYQARIAPANPAAPAYSATGRRTRCK
ncbi:hypothetical protein H4R26_001056 [Coemansia thaxteri]|uniref:Chitin-binding type-4 domain-containing protein n=1 Tax=Coemansia thaxteri TaxID=2663907 RepID=A0A9W8BLJ0_9FUNG|nr:hypothetical protein H4R26_001056 [Coemansia thaxteri]KAJ2485111.1 hypothetical protein EV174_001950 [Coemansia sp. RSA 2320]